MENIKGKQNPSQISKPSAIAQIGKTKYAWASIFVQEVPRVQNNILALCFYKAIKLIVGIDQNCLM